MKTKRALRSAVDVASRGIPLASLIRLADTAPLIVLYHVVSDEDLPHIKHLYPYKGPQRFEADLDFFLRSYNPVDLEDLLAYGRGEKVLPRNAIFFTLDDGLREVYEIACPLLKRKGIPAAFFVSTAFLDNKDLCYRFKASILIHTAEGTRSHLVEKAVKDMFNEQGLLFEDMASALLSLNYQQRRLLDRIAEAYEVDMMGYLRLRKPYMDSSQVRTLVKQGFHLGAHSIDHPLFRLVSIEEQVRQTVQSITELKHEFGLNHNLFAFPFSAQGVTREYFTRMRERMDIDAYFGTNGLGCNPRIPMFDRLAFETANASRLKIEYLSYLRGKVRFRLLH